MAKRSKRSTNPDKLGTPGFTRRSLSVVFTIYQFFAMYGAGYLLNADPEMLKSPLYVAIVTGVSVLVGSFWARRIRPDLFA